MRCQVLHDNFVGFVCFRFGVSFLLGDKTAGPFKLEVDWIKVERSE
jgi:hypothetical protein